MKDFQNSPSPKLKDFQKYSLCEEILNSVRILKEKIAELEKHIQALRLSAENLVPILDGMPRATDIRSRVETIGVKVITAEEDLRDLREELIQAKEGLMRRILDDIADPTTQTLLALRYVECLSFRKIAARMHYTLRQVFRLHEYFLKKLSPA